MEKNLSWEAEFLAKYLLKCGRLPEELIQRYEAANQKLIGPKLNPKEEKLIHLWHRYPFLFPFLEAAFVFQTNSIIRRKTVIMLALLETATQFTSAFEEKSEKGLFVFLKLLWEGSISIIKMGVGFLLCVSRGLL